MAENNALYLNTVCTNSPHYPKCEEYFHRRSLSNFLTFRRHPNWMFSAHGTKCDKFYRNIHPCTTMVISCSLYNRVVQNSNLSKTFKTIEINAKH